jgi:type I restriction enzyme S subunit
MQYRLGDICTITKGATGIMKAIPGAYTMIALGETDKTHSEYQFDAKAVIIPLVSSTGHGHASMKRVKYYEGKFALGNILCAVIPKDENFVLAKYLHIYLHWNREELLVSQMKGMANVSLPMNRIADVMVTIPSIEKQREIVSLEKELAVREIEILRLYEGQITQIENLNQAILQEAVQGKLVQQNLKDGSASELLKRIKVERAKSGKKEKPLAPIKPEEIPFEIPDNWVWCRLGEIVNHNSGKTLDSGKNRGELREYITTSNLYWDSFDLSELRKMPIQQEDIERCTAIKGDLLICEGGEAGRSAVWNFDNPICFQNHIHRVRPKGDINPYFIYYFMRKIFYSGEIQNYRKGMGIHNLSGKALSSIILPLPPLSEQKRIVAKIEKQLAQTKQLKERVIANQQATEELLKALLHQAFEAKEIVNEETKAKVVEVIPKICNDPEKAMLAGHIINMTNNEDFGRVKFQKMLHLTEYFCKIDMGSNYVQKVAGPHDDNLIKSIESTLKRLRFYEIRQQGFHAKVNYMALASASELDSLENNHFLTGKAVERYFDLNKALFEFDNLFPYEGKDERSIAILGGTFLEMILEHILLAFLPEDEKEVNKRYSS